VKALDRALRRYRTRVALRELPSSPRAVFDIGCDDGYLLASIGDDHTRRDGCDPVVSPSAERIGDTVLKGFFPEVVIESAPFYEPGDYDALTALAVFEHFEAEHFHQASPVLAEMLSDSGRLVATVPHPFVDTILHVLMFLRVIDGQEAHQHHGFDPRTLADHLPDLRLVKRRRFQLGLNYLFVFERRSKRA